VAPTAEYPRPGLIPRDFTPNGGPSVSPQRSLTQPRVVIAPGVNAKALSSYMGHASITITLDRYGHLMPGNEREAAGMLDTYLARAKSNAPPAVR
jgi:hypothetical protein